MKKDQILFVALSPVILGAAMVSAASEAFVDFVKRYRSTLQDLGRRRP